MQRKCPLHPFLLKNNKQRKKYIMQAKEKLLGKIFLIP